MVRLCWIFMDVYSPALIHRCSCSRWRRSFGGRKHFQQELGELPLWISDVDAAVTFGTQFGVAFLNNEVCKWFVESGVVNNFCRSDCCPQEEPPPSCVVLPSTVPPGDTGAVLRLSALLGVPVVLVLGGMGSARRNKVVGWDMPTSIRWMISLMVNNIVVNFFSHIFSIRIQMDPVPHGRWTLESVARRFASLSCNDGPTGVCPWSHRRPKRLGVKSKS